ncbi:MAG: transposase [Moorea sp. SIO1F2]|uniref:transposase n=1 Tax=Moorena sp. SIO1F2 TaxID=2607819 RepID=UPI0013BB512E|nr:transposase [Moorena sp. SIO1F2]NET81814.1 transposase [Moorena sp. SIO1F2]
MKSRLRKAYKSDVTDAEWKIIEPLPAPKSGGRPRTVNMREVINGIFYVQQNWMFMGDDAQRLPTIVNSIQIFSCL